MHALVLIIDDEQDIRLSLRGILEDEGFEVIEAATGEEGSRLALEQSPDLVLLDIWLPGQDGLEVLDFLHLRLPDLPVIMISGHGNIETAVTAIKKGAHDFIEKPLSLEKIVVSVQKALEFGRLKAENIDLKKRMTTSHVQEIGGRSPAVARLRELVAQVAPTEAWVLISGENGTGKEIVARSIHAQSRRKEQPLVAVNCAAIPEELIESELFGHEKGSFTGASASRKGRFEKAHGGTLFLDEIGDMSLKTQAKILRILQEQTFERIGGTRPLRVDVRVVAATNKNLEDEIQGGRFRQDLYYRLRVFPIHVPPLRERAEDLPVLLEEFIVFMCREHNFKPIRFTPESIRILTGYSWPGNVRELKNFVERVFIMYPGLEIGPDMLPSEFTDSGLGLESSFPPGLPADFKDARQEFEAWFLKTRLAECGGNVSKLAEAIGLERSHLHRKLKTLGVTA
ncbi:MAG: sigma-54-dependent Fis family transcriptional regulator [Deltaproteobacteria bacterium]|nr:sigma-54-dependent Fis family transcriptional regulator [Deltaproteobacteria bacterium]